MGFFWCSVSCATESRNVDRITINERPLLARVVDVPYCTAADLHRLPLGKPQYVRCLIDTTRADRHDGNVTDKLTVGQTNGQTDGDNFGVVKVARCYGLRKQANVCGIRIGVIFKKTIFLKPLVILISQTF